MARRSVVMDGSLRYFEVSVPCVETLMAGGYVRPVLAHYVGDFEDANVYRPIRLPLERVFTVAGASALSEIKQGSGGGGGG